MNLRLQLHVYISIIAESSVDLSDPGDSSEKLNASVERNCDPEIEQNNPSKSGIEQSQEGCSTTKDNTKLELSANVSSMLENDDVNFLGSAHDSDREHEADSVKVLFSL